LLNLMKSLRVSNQAKFLKSLRAINQAKSRKSRFNLFQDDQLDHLVSALGTVEDILGHGDVAASGAADVGGATILSVELLLMISLLELLRSLCTMMACR